MQAQEAANNKALEGAKLGGILREAIQMFKDGESTGRSFTKDHIKSILILCYKTNPSRSSRKGAMLTYLGAKLN